MILLRPACERGHTEHEGLASRHSFSFGGYHDPGHVHWGPLRVINEDRIGAGCGLGRHGHRDMEIISYVLEGALGQRDSMGNSACIVPGDVQRMSAGSGVIHSEFNHVPSDRTRFLQIWILPAVQGLAPSYEQTHFEAADRRGRLRRIVSPDGREGSVRIHQDACLYSGLFDGDERAELPLAPGRLGYVHVARGEVVVDGHALGAGDALRYRAQPSISIGPGRDAEVLVFDLPLR